MAHKFTCMTPVEFKRRLTQLQGVISLGLSFYAVWNALSFHEEGKAHLSLKETNRVLKRFGRFFTPARLALHYMMLMQFAKAFDEHKRAASLPNLLSMAQQDQSLAPNATRQDLDAISQKIAESAKVLENIKTLRDQRLAHSQANPRGVSLLAGEVDGLVEAIQEAFNRLRVAHDGGVVIWGPPALDEPAEHTAEVLRILGEEMGREDRRFEMWKSE